MSQVITKMSFSKIDMKEMMETDSEKVNKIKRKV